MAHIPPPEFSTLPREDEDSTHACSSCGYDLRGLPWGSSCPECGQEPRQQAEFLGAIAKDIPLSQMPETFVRRFALCCIAATVVLPAVVARAFVPYFQFQNDSIAFSVDLVIAAMWIGGVGVLTNPMNHPLAIRYGLGVKGKFRLIARWCSLAVVGIAILAHAPPSLPVSICFTTSILVAGVGLICLFLLLVEISIWVRDTTAKKFLEAAAWGAPALGLAAQVTTFLPVSPLIILVFALGAVTLLLGGIVGMMMLTSSVVRAIGHARDYESYQERRLKSKDSTQFPKPP